MTLLLRLTAEQLEIIHACGSEVLPIAGYQFHVLLQQRRIFHSGDDAVVVRRPTGFLETRGTLELLFTQHSEAVRSLSTAAQLPPEAGSGVRATDAASRGGRLARASGGPESSAPVPVSARPARRMELETESSRQPVLPSPTGQGSRTAGLQPPERLPSAPGEVRLPTSAQPPSAHQGGSTPLQPAVPIEDSVYPDHLVCLEDGRRMKMLTRHIRTAYGLSPKQYRDRWSLPPDYPMVAPDTAQRRLVIAQQPRPGARGRAGRKPAAASA